MRRGRTPQPEPTAAELLTPGRRRTAAINAAAGTLHLAVGVCGDRAQAIARATVDAALRAAQETRP